MNPGSFEHETCSKTQLIPYIFREYQYLKMEVWTKVAPFHKSTYMTNADRLLISTALSPTCSDSALSRNLSTTHEITDSCSREKPLGL